MSHHYPYQDDPVWERGQYGHGPTTTTVIQPNYHGKTTDSSIYRVGIYGWRKRCLYLFILLLTVVIIINLALTAWIMNVLDFSSSGMGPLEIHDDGIKVTGKAEFDRPVHFRNLATSEGRVLSIDSAKGLNMNARNLTGHQTASFHLTAEGKAEATCNRFEVFNDKKELLFFVDQKEIGLKLENLRILDEGGSVFEGAVQTGIIRPEPDTPLQLESPTRNLLVDAAQDIEILSRAGDIQATALLDINIQAKQGEIRMDSPNVFISGLQQSNGQGQTQLQICICENGRLFLARNQADCRADRGICE
uniref:Sarcoglycan delta n=1 Tax=Plectus sambesii TaxID=2011161 RepID=A0A914VPU4_9BILA